MNISNGLSSPKFAQLLKLDFVAYFFNQFIALFNVVIDVNFIPGKEGER